MREEDKLKYDEDYILSPSSRAEEVLPIRDDNVVVVKKEDKPNVDDLYFDILKYWRIVRKWALDSNPTLNGGELDMLLYLYREPPFDIVIFKEAVSLMSWDRGRLERMIINGWIDVYRERKTKRKQLYCLSRKTKNLIASIYNKLLQKDPMPEKSIYFSKEASFSEKMYREAIKRMNAKRETSLLDKS